MPTTRLRLLSAASKPSSTACVLVLPTANSSSSGVPTLPAKTCKSRAIPWAMSSRNRSSPGELLGGGAKEPNGRATSTDSRDTRGPLSLLCRSRACTDSVQARTWTRLSRRSWNRASSVCSWRIISGDSPVGEGWRGSAPLRCRARSIRCSAEGLAPPGQGPAPSSASRVCCSRAVRMGAYGGGGGARGGSSSRDGRSESPPASKAGKSRTARRTIARGERDIGGSFGLANRLR